VIAAFLQDSADAGCPTLRGFRSVGTTNLNSMFTAHSQAALSVLNVTHAKSVASLLRRGLSALHYDELLSAA
jgi:hypothetical protein